MSMINENFEETGFRFLRELVSLFQYLKLNCEFK